MDYIQRRRHGLELFLSLPVQLPSIARVAFADEVHAPGLRPVENLAETLLVGQQTGNVVLRGSAGAGASGRDACLLILRSCGTILDRQAGRGAAPDERGQGAASGWHWVRVLIMVARDGWGRRPSRGPSAWRGHLAIIKTDESGGGAFESNEIGDEVDKKSCASGIGRRFEFLAACPRSVPGSFWLCLSAVDAAGFGCR